jgi:hypothetical protein
MTLTGRDLPEAVPTQYFSANSLNVLGVPPLIGRVFNEADGPAGEQPQRVVVLTYRSGSDTSAARLRPWGRPSL